MFEQNDINIFGSREKIRNQMLDYAKLYLDVPEINFTKTSYLSYLINTMSALSANIFFYNSAIYKEMFLTKAEQPESIYNWASILGYETSLGIPSTVDLTLQLNTNFGSSVELVLNGRSSYKNPISSFQLKPVEFFGKLGSKNVTFVPENEIRIALTIDNGKLLNVDVKQYREEDVYGSDIPYQITADRQHIYFRIKGVQVVDKITEFTIPYLRPREFFVKEIQYSGQLADVVFQTKVRNEPDVPWTTWDWETNRNSIYLSDPSKEEYAFRPGNNKLKLYFGNGVIGKQPNPGDIARVIVSTTEGYDGNVIAGSVKSMSAVYANTVTGNQNTQGSVNIKVLNYNSAYGGKDYPSLDEIKYNAIQQITSNKRLVTENDFENISSIVPDLPIVESFPVVKRSDLKSNEITLFSTLNYAGDIVPTRNAKINAYLGENIGTGSNIYIEPRYAYIYQGPDDTTGSIGEYIYVDITGEHNKYTLRAGKDVITYEGEEFYPLFNMELDISSKTAKYYYIIDEVLSSIELQGYYNRVVVYPKNCSFRVYDELQTVLQNNVEVEVPIEKVEIKFSCKTSAVSQYEIPKCYITLGDGYTSIENNQMEASLNLETGEVDFTFELEVIRDVPEGENTFYFDVWGRNIETGDYEKSAVYKTEITIRKDLDNFMYSLVKLRSNGSWDIYDVPLLRKLYWDNLVSSEIKTDFIQNVYEKISNFTVSDYKMMTDFINLKFSNTFGKLTNLKYNKVKETIRGINVDDLPVNLTEPKTDDNGNVSYVKMTNPNWVITDMSRDNPWGKTGNPFIASYDFDYNDWRFRPLVLNDIFNYIYYEGEELKSNYVIYNGFSIVNLEDKDIPINLQLDVYVEKRTSSTDQYIINKIKDEIIDNMYLKFGYEKPIYISEITEIVQNIEEVKSCKVLKPEHDIFFGYDIYKDLSQKQLLEYSPQMVMINKNSIFVNIRK